MHHLFKRGVFKVYVATQTFHLGAVENLVINVGDEVEFDGLELKIGNDSYSCKTARGAVKQGWLKDLEEDEGEGFRPLPAGIVMAPANRAKTTESTVASGQVVSDDERIVGDVEGVRETARSRPQRITGKSQMPIVSVDQGVAIGKVTTPSEFQTKLGSKQQLDIHKKQLEKGAKFIKNPNLAGSDLAALLPDAEIAGMTEEERAEWEAEKEARELALREAEAEAAARREARLAEMGSDLPLADLIEEAPEEKASNIVRTSIGVDWDLGISPWTKRASIAVQQYGKSRDILLAIAKVEQKGAAKRIRAFVEKNLK
jgi:hypothetical protein